MIVFFIDLNPELLFLLTSSGLGNGSQQTTHNGQISRAADPT
jgi:hypothetical protein